jgi:hypothetical protein
MASRGGVRVRQLLSFPPEPDQMTHPTRPAWVSDRHLGSRQEEYVKIILVFDVFDVRRSWTYGLYIESLSCRQGLGRSWGRYFEAEGLRRI